jgi:hypothetical protein
VVVSRGTYGSTPRGRASIAAIPSPYVAVPGVEARARAIRAIFDLHAKTHAPLYVYAEVDGAVDKRASWSVEEANAIFFARERLPGEIYVAIFDVEDVRWPAPAFDVQRRRAPPAPVGLKLTHLGAGDSERAVGQLDTTMHGLLTDMYLGLGVDLADLLGRVIPREIPFGQVWLQPVDPDSTIGWHGALRAIREHAKKSPYWDFFNAVFSPVYQDWQKFHEDQTRPGGWSVLFTTWEEYEKWLERVRQLRKEMIAAGLRVQTPEPADLSETLGASALRKLGSGAEEIFKILKWGLVGVLAIGGVVVLSGVVQNLRSGTDPTDKYLDLLSRRPRKQRSPRALAPTPEMKALKAGEPEDSP